MACHRACAREKGAQPQRGNVPTGWHGQMEAPGPVGILVSAQHGSCPYLTLRRTYGPHSPARAGHRPLASQMVDWSPPCQPRSKLGCQWGPGKLDAGTSAQGPVSCSHITRLCPAAMPPRKADPWVEAGPRGSGQALGRPQGAVVASGPHWRSRASHCLDCSQGSWGREWAQGGTSGTGIYEAPAAGLGDLTSSSQCPSPPAAGVNIGFLSSLIVGFPPGEAGPPVKECVCMYPCACLVYACVCTCVQ